MKGFWSGGNSSKSHNLIEWHPGQSHEMIVAWFQSRIVCLNFVSFRANLVSGLDFFLHICSTYTSVSLINEAWHGHRHILWLHKFNDVVMQSACWCLNCAYAPEIHVSTVAKWYNNHSARFFHLNIQISVCSNDFSFCCYITMAW